MVSVEGSGSRAEKALTTISAFPSHSSSIYCVVKGDRSEWLPLIRTARRICSGELLRRSEGNTGGKSVSHGFSPRVFCRGLTTASLLRTQPRRTGRHSRKTASGTRTARCLIRAWSHWACRLFRSFLQRSLRRTREHLPGTPRAVRQIPGLHFHARGSTALDRGLTAPHRVDSVRTL